MPLRAVDIAADGNSRLFGSISRYLVGLMQRAVLIPVAGEHRPASSSRASHADLAKFHRFLPLYTVNQTAVPGEAPLRRSSSSSTSSTSTSRNTTSSTSSLERFLLPEELRTPAAYTNGESFVGESDQCVAYHSENIFEKMYRVYGIPLPMMIDCMSAHFSLTYAWTNMTYCSQPEVCGYVDRMLAEMQLLDAQQEASSVVGGIVDAPKQLLQNCHCELCAWADAWAQPGGVPTPEGCDQSLKENLQDPVPGGSRSRPAFGCQRAAKVPVRANRPQRGVREFQTRLCAGPGACGQWSRRLPRRLLAGRGPPLLGLFLLSLFEEVHRAHHHPGIESVAPAVDADPRRGTRDRVLGQHLRSTLLPGHVRGVSALSKERRRVSVQGETASVPRFRPESDRGGPLLRASGDALPELHLPWRKEWSFLGKTEWRCNRVPDGFSDPSGFLSDFFFSFVF